jgi:hypothetical protein
MRQFHELGISKLELTTLWEKGENKTSSTGAATANVTSTQTSQGDRTDGIASNQNGANSTCKNNTLLSKKQWTDNKKSTTIRLSYLNPAAT